MAIFQQIQSCSSLMYTCIVTTLIATLLTYMYFKKFRYWSKQGINGPMPIPPFGNILELFTPGSSVDKLDEHWKKYGQIYGMYNFTAPRLFTCDPEMIKDVLVRDWTVFVDRIQMKKTGNPVFDNFITVLSGNEWKRMRSTISPTFSSGKMKSMFHVMNDCGTLMVRNINNRIKSNPVAGVYELDVRHLAGCYTMDVIAKCCFATDTNSFDDPHQQFVTKAKEFGQISKLQLLIIMVIFMMPNRLREFLGLRMFPSVDFFTDVSKSVLEQRRSNPDQPGGYKDYLQLLIDASKGVQGPDPVSDDGHDNESHHGHESANIDPVVPTSDLKRPLNDDEIIANSVLFFAVGYDTTGSLITMATYLLTLNQDAQMKLYHELLDINKENSNKFNYDTISGSKYLDAVVSETLRLMPPAPAIERSVKEDYTFKGNGIKVSKGSSVAIPVWNIHHDPKNWPEPEKFLPERFLPENRGNIIPYTYLPFSAGPRNCVGMRFALIEAKLAIAHLVLNYKFEPCSRTDIPLDLSRTIGLLNPKRVIVSVESRSA